MVVKAIEEKRRYQREVNCVNKYHEKDKNIILYQFESKIEKIKEEEKQKLEELETTRLEMLKTLEEMFPVNCDHSIIIKSNDSMLTGSVKGLIPNPNHISYYCLGCGKKMSYDEIAPWSNIIDFFGHPDALLVGKNHNKAIVDFLRYKAYKIGKNNPSYSDDKISEILVENFDRVPKRFIRNK